MLWQASNNIGKAGQLFTGVLHNGYNPPDGMHHFFTSESCFFSQTKRLSLRLKNRYDSSIFQI